MSPKYRVVILDRPVAGWGDPLVQELFAKLVTLRLSGYGARYAQSVLPLDTNDFISTHIMLCTESERGLLPRMAYRHTSFEQCAAFGLPFPVLAPMLAVGATRHAHIVRDTLARCERERKAVDFVGSWTIDPAVRSDRNMFRELWEITIALCASHNREHRVAEAFGGAVVCLRTERLLGACGLRPVLDEGAPLPPVGIPHLRGEQILLMHRTGIPDEALALADKWRWLWEGKVIAGGTSDDPAERCGNAEGPVQRTLAA
jgi:hypothetical protein